MRKTRDDTLHLRLDGEFKAQIEAAAKRLDIPVAAYTRMALREFLERHSSTLRESGTGYTAPPPPPESPPVKLRNAIAPLPHPTAFFVVQRTGKRSR
jgi:hypothetical protein